VSLTVTDAAGHKSKTTTQTFDVSACGSNAPIIHSLTATPPSALSNQVVTLSADVDDADNASGCDLGQALDFHWSLVGLPPGSKAQINGPSAQKPSFVTDFPGDYVVRLDVTDSTGRTAESQTTTVKAAACGSASPVITNIVPSPASVNTGDTFTLSAVVTDANTGAGCSLPQSFTFAWNVVAAPMGSTAKLSDSAALTPTLTPDVPGDYKIHLVVSDANGLKDEQESVIAVTTCGSAAPAVGAVHASAPAPVIGQTTQLMADVADADTTSACGLTRRLSYQWTFVQKPAGSTATFDDATAEMPSFTPDVAGTFKVAVAVRDQAGRISTLTFLTINSAACGGAPPVIQSATATPQVQPIALFPVQLNAVVTDADNQAPCNLHQTFTYNWSIVSLPLGSQALVNASTAQNASLITSVIDGQEARQDYPGDYTLQLSVTDSTGLTSDAVQVHTKVLPCGSATPVINRLDYEDLTPPPPGVPAPVHGKGDGGGDQVYVGDLVVLEATVTDADDACGFPKFKFYTWFFQDQPPGSLSLINPALEEPYFVPDQPGEYTIRVVVADVTKLVSIPMDISINAIPRP
jgi:hypothetical protein